MNQADKGDLYLLCRIGGSHVAFPAATIEAVVKAEVIVPVPGAPRAIRGLAAIRSRLLTVIDCALMVGVPNGTARFMAVVSLAGHGYGLLLDDVIDVAALNDVQPLPGKPDAGWQQLEPMLASHCDAPILVIDCERFVDLAQLNIAQAA
jgi:purine-binding chemotaxis protein CheW